MSIVKSFSVGNGDMYYVRHNSDNFTILDCCLPSDRQGAILAEISAESRDKGVHRFLSTHPDQDHIAGLVELDDLLGITNFYCVENAASKSSPTKDFERYSELRDSDKAYFISAGCARQWMNRKSDDRGSSGLDVLWPVVGNEHHASALADAAAGLPANNISPIVRYSLVDGVTMLWMGDLETDFMEKLEGVIDLPDVDVLHAPHHGRTSGKVPKGWLEQLDPRLVVVGSAPSEYLDYYNGYDILTQNSAGDLLFDCQRGVVDVYASEHTYVADCLMDHGLDHLHGLYYIGSLATRAP